MCELFSYRGVDCHPSYEGLITDTGDGEHVKFLRHYISGLWEKFAPYADPHFVSEFRLNPNQRYWEMYLGCFLLERGFAIRSQKHGPDFFLELSGKRIWIEAVTASSGKSGSPDQVPEIVSLSQGGGAQAVPRDKIILRYRSSLAEKEKKFSEYIGAGVVGSNDIKVIAISCGELKRWPDSDTLPYILSAVYPMGHEYLSFSQETGEVVDQGRHFQPHIHKNNGAEVETLFFLDEAHNNISAVIYGGSDIGNPPHQIGDDLLIAYNPLAKSPLTRGSLKLPRDFWMEDNGEFWRLQSECL